MVIAYISVIFALILLFDYIPIIKEKNKKEIILYGILFALSYCVLILHELNILLPGPDIPIKYFIQNVLKLT